ncbi:hypothetical protein [Leptolyngbya sp. FACHB-261]|uniref:hypothetical protein n=1 Tax=Leptolyngbya sp. FACHB-261 TaxID=2692806 RepID=UPI0016885750|nr:hypothetical protein [Leptolyngbya sp. FACHB-261]MBD2099485.1 hypothetical protein [Leptolyngbya sp. FACHB-261]
MERDEDRHIDDLLARQAETLKQIRGLLEQIRRLLAPISELAHQEVEQQELEPPPAEPEQAMCRCCGPKKLWSELEDREP